ncbi:MAG: MotA/TolQ/ExbB proton channel family protein [Deltaproteobacteria bacterium]|nr:MotA/TolQ/ExbB proton channel family protein [Deltaproteobacteria bacterium]MBW1966409.1 MotA/TolQ/ExbB proton channel family protein [Deltaproteobacteria bacterium]MBW2097840.1 MotA/TolQ/ExbB proton channel family protein [Deltaproteobacteria bacterium]
MRYGLILIGIFLFTLFTLSAHAQDMREAAIKAKADREAALAEAGESAKRIAGNRASLENEISRMAAEVKGLKADIKAMSHQLEKLRKKKAELVQQQSGDEMDMRELAGTVRVVARDLEGVLEQSLFTARFPERLNDVRPVLNKERFPGLDDMKALTGLFFKEMSLSGEVVLRRDSFVDRSGTVQEGNILTIGKFTAAYEAGGETGFLNYSPGSHRLFALSALPSWSVRKNLSQYIKGGTEDVTLDFSGGAALRQITHRPTLVERIKQGGPIVWPILAIGVFAILIVIERTLFLARVHGNTDLIMGKVNEHASEGRWTECETIVSTGQGQPCCNVLRCGLDARKEDRETLESILQEGILKEVPRLERYLPVLNILAAIAPLLGLLGTVTGMISTFHVITLYGTGDPRMMAGGISEALVTTMLGLAVAIPIMLAHTFLSRRVDHVIGDMEEKAVALTNIIARNGHCRDRQIVESLSR